MKIIHNQAGNIIKIRELFFIWPTELLTLYIICLLLVKNGAFTNYLTENHTKMLLPPMRAPMISCCLVVCVCIQNLWNNFFFFRETKSVCCVSARVASCIGRVGEEVEKSRRFDFGFCGTMSCAVQIYSRRQPKWIIIDDDERTSFGIALDCQVLVFPSFQNWIRICTPYLGPSGRHDA